MVYLQVESAYEHGKVTYSLTIVPKGNFTVSCMVSNVLGSDIKSINVSARKCNAFPLSYLISEPLCITGFLCQVKSLRQNC